MENIKLDSSAGSHFDNVSAKAKEIASEKGRVVEFEFNGVTCIVNSDTDLELLYRDYSNSWTMELKSVGPVCEKEYSESIATELAKRNKAAEEKAAEQREEYRKKDQAQREAFEKSVSGVELELSDADAWNKSREVNSDPYGAAGMDYAEGWAKLMQIEISKGKTVAECANETQNGLGFMGITGFMYGCAVGILSSTWKHGEELRKWHNKQYGVSEDKTGVVNPAILSIG